MPYVLGVDLGTTSITGLALDLETGGLASVSTLPNDCETTTEVDKLRGRSEWDASRIINKTCECLRAVVQNLGTESQSCLGIGITGQQHGVVIVDECLEPLGPLINWQDRRGLDPCQGSNRTVVERAIELIGPEAPQRTGCRLATGYLGTTLFWMKVHGMLPRVGTACFLADYFAARLTSTRPVTEPTSAASSGLLDVALRQWASDLVAALELPIGLLPEVQNAGRQLGTLTALAADNIGLPAGVPVFVAIGDNQSAFVGSVTSRERSVLVNVGTGAQVAAYTDRFVYVPPLETRPFPKQGNLLVNAGLCGGRSYALLERFFHDIGEQVLGARVERHLYDAMNKLAEQVPAGAGGLNCRPLFTGTRADPGLRGEWTGISPENFTPAHLIRALLEGMARVFHEGFKLIQATTGQCYDRLIGSGNGLRENPVLARIVAQEFSLPLELPRHREEAAVGAALLATVGAGAFPDLDGAVALVCGHEQNWHGEGARQLQ